MGGISYLDRKDLFDSLSIELSSNSLDNQSLNFFAADINHTVTRFLHNKKCTCIQLGIDYNFLAPARGDLYAQRTAQLLQALLRFIDDVDTLETLQIIRKSKGCLHQEFNGLLIKISLKSYKCAILLIQKT